MESDDFGYTHESETLYHLDEEESIGYIHFGYFKVGQNNEYNKFKNEYDGSSYICTTNLGDFTYTPKNCIENQQIPQYSPDQKYETTSFVKKAYPKVKISGKHMVNLTKNGFLTLAQFDIINQQLKDIEILKNNNPLSNRDIEFLKQQKDFLYFAEYVKNEAMAQKEYDTIISAVKNEYKLKKEQRYAMYQQKCNECSRKSI